MTNLISLKSNIANTLQSSNKKMSRTNFKSSKNILNKDDFKTFLELYLNNETEFYERIDGYDGFISTQQIESIDYDSFSEHVFFDSAVEKVNYAFSKSINDFPYDSSKYKFNQYLKKLDGFTRYVLDKKVKKSINYLSFDSNTVLEVVDKKGHLLDDFKGKNFNNNFDPDGKTISFDFWIYPKTTNLTETVCVLKKYSNNYGFLITIDHTENSDSKINFIVVERNNFFKVSYKIENNKFQHVFFDIKSTITNNIEVNRSYRLIIDGKEINQDSNSLTSNGNINSLTLKYKNISDFYNEKLYVGASNTRQINFLSSSLTDIAFNRGFLGLLDELKISIGIDYDIEDILKNKNENTFASEGLKLYYKFNEPAGNYSNNHIILDYSGNKLHSVLRRITQSNPDFEFADFDNTFTRNGLDVDVATPLIYEKAEINPVLFSSASQNEKAQMLSDAAEYDLINPNSFWKLFPKNIFLEGSDYDNIESTYVSNKNKPSSNVLGTERSVNQELVKLISIWARFFDQLKMYIDSFTEILNFDYDTINKNKKIDGMILPLALNQAGFKFRELQAIPVTEKLDGKNLSHEQVMSDISIRQIQNILWKRFLLNSKDYLMSKGTKRSIRSVFNSFGLEASKYVSIKEINGQNRLNINNQFTEYSKRVKFVNFNSNSKVFELDQYNANNVTNKVCLFTSTFSKSTQSQDNGKINFENDWSAEHYFCYDKNKLKMFKNQQSIFRVDRLVNDEINFDKPFINVVFERKNNTVESGELKVYAIFSDGSINSDTIENVNLLNGVLYHFCLRKKYNEVTGNYEYKIDITPAGRLSYAIKYSIEIETDQNYVDSANTTNKYRFSIGSYKYNDQINSSENPGISYETSFQGKITNFRAYQGFIDESVKRIKTKDIDFLGLQRNKIIKDELKINLDLSQNIPENFTQTSNQLFNFTHNVNNANKETVNLFVGENLLTGNQIETKYLFTSEEISLLEQGLQIDTPDNSNKVYINSLDTKHSKDQFLNQNTTFSSQHHPDYLYFDDQRLYIDFSSVKFLNQDISKLISVNDHFTQILSQTSCLYEDSYINLKELNDIYFKRLDLNSNDLNFQMLYQVYKYFDNILEDLLVDAVPSRVNYLGFNFVYESHMLERNKYQYRSGDSRIRASAHKDFTYQEYGNIDNLKAYRKDDISGYFNNSIIKKV